MEEGWTRARDEWATSAKLRRVLGLGDVDVTRGGYERTHAMSGSNSGRSSVTKGSGVRCNSKCDNECEGSGSDVESEGEGRTGCEGVTEDVDSGSEMGTMSVVHEDTAKTANDRRHSIGRGEGKDAGKDMGSSSGITLLHEGATWEKEIGKVKLV
jgi:hypothetical protein